MAMDMESPLDFDAAHRRSCCCCWISEPEWWRRIQSPERLHGVGGWWLSQASAAVMKVREWSEIVAGPKWKTFIRRFNRNPKRIRNGGTLGFQYDPLSYKLNFDEGSDGFDAGGEFGGNDGRDFSTRFVLPASSKSTVDVGGCGPAAPYVGVGRNSMM